MFRRSGLLIAVAIVAGCGSTGLGSSRDTEAPVVPRGDAEFYGEIPAGTQFEVQLQQKLGTEDSQVGDRWSAVVVEDVTNGERVLLQQGSVVTGEVTRVGPVEIEGEEHQILAVEPQALEVGGRSYALDAKVIDAEQKEGKDLLNRENIAIVGGGTLAGAILGELILDDALLGAVLGAAGGSAIAVARSDTEIELEQGSILTLQLESAVRPAETAQVSLNR